MNNKYNKYFMPDLNAARKRIKSAKIHYHLFHLTDSQKSLGYGKSYFIRTYGCQSNVKDSENIAGILQAMNFHEADNLDNADVIILNTCAIRENAEKKVFGEIGFLKRLKNKNPNLKFGICGCMAQEEKVVKKIINDISHLDFVMGTHNIHELGAILEQCYNTNELVIKVSSKEGDIIEGLPSVFNSSIKSFVNVMYGCDKFCTYCIVPYTRGKIRSRKIDDILNEINELIKLGYKEVTLIGQNVNAYGIDLNDGNNFCSLLEKVCETNIERVRFVTSNPWNFDDNIAFLFKKHKNLMPYLHLPIQSGNEQMLKSMNRTMPIQRYYDIVNNLRKEVPDIAITTDLIVGFPNETEEQFQDTLKLYNDIKFDNAYTFIYSPREGTPAANIKDHLSLAEKEKRLAELNLLVRKYARENNEKWVGKIVQVLVESKSKKNQLKWTGYSPQWKVVNFTGECQIGQIVNVKIKRAYGFSLEGEIIKK